MQNSHNNFFKTKIHSRPTSGKHTNINIPIPISSRSTSKIALPLSECNSISSNSSTSTITSPTKTQMLKIPKLENLDCLNVVEPEILNQDELQARYQAEIDKLLFENLSVKENQNNSLDKLLNQRDTMNQKIEKRRKEKAKSARVKIIKDLRQGKKDLEKENMDKISTKTKKLKQKAHSIAISKTKAKPLPNLPTQTDPKTPKSPKVDKKLANSTDSNQVLKSPSPTASLKSNTLDLILNDLEKIENNAIKTINQTEKVKTPPEIESFGDELVSTKINSIMSYLDQVEKETSIPSPKTTNHPKQNIESTVHNITNSVLTQKLKLDEAKQAIKILENSLNKQRELSIHQMKQTELDLSTRIKIQKEHYESAISRHLTFIDQLISDKKKIQEKCENLAEKLKVAGESANELIEKERRQHKESVNLLKDQYLTAEKDRREKWISEQTKIIKKSTVNALEPEISRLMASHKQEISRLKTLHEADIIDADERASKKYVDQINKMRIDLENERDEGVEKERLAAQRRADKLIEQENMAFQSQKRRLYQEIAEEKERLFQQSNKLKKDNNEFKTQLENHQSAAAKALSSEFEKTKLVLENRHIKEIENLKSEQKSEIEILKRKIEKDFETAFIEKEKNITESLKIQRDKEIKMVIERLESEHQENRSCDSAAVENRIRRVREKYESEVREIERSERMCQQKYLDVKQKLIIENESKMNITRELKQIKIDFNEQQIRLNRLISEKDKIRDVVRDEFSERLVLLEDENSRIKREFSEQRARHKLDLSNVKNEKESELKSLHERVKQTILRKDESISGIKRQQEMAENRAKHLEELLEEQRKLLLNK